MRACCAPRPVAPTGARMTSGTLHRAAGHVAQHGGVADGSGPWRRTESRRTAHRRSGASPAWPRPTATPKKPFSAMGVSIMRSGNFFSSPSVTVNAPPQPPGTPISSPMQNTRGSRSHFLGDRVAQRFSDSLSDHHVIRPQNLLRHTHRSVRSATVGFGRLLRLARSPAVICCVDRRLDSIQVGRLACPLRRPAPRAKRWIGSRWPSASRSSFGW